MRELLATAWITGFWRDSDRGATAVEYALMAGLVAAVVVGGVTALGLVVNGHFDAGARVLPP